MSLSFLTLDEGFCDLRLRGLEKEMILTFQKHSLRRSRTVDRLT